MQNKPFGIIQLSLICLASILLTACGSGTSVDEKQSEPLVRPAKLLEVGLRNDESFLSYPAVIKSQKLSSLSFEVGGVLKEITVVEAQAVKKGDVLARLDQRDLLEQLKSARAQYDNANTEYQRAVRLMKEDAISRSELEQRKSKREVNKAGLETAKIALQDSVLMAPYDGNISKISITEQQTVQAGEAAIGILGAGGLEAIINLPSSILAKSRKKEDPANSSYIILDAAPDNHIPAQFKEASLQADATSQTYEVTFSFDTPTEVNILPGMNATVWFKDPSKTATQTAQTSIPLTAIAIDGEQKYVWVVNKESMVVTRRNITLEEGIGDYLNVLSGLKAGDTIVAAGVSSLSEGMAVRAWSSK